MHSNGRTLGELSSAVDYGVSRFVIDSTGQIAQLAAVADRPQQVLLRVTPGIGAHAVEGAAAGGDEYQQFGFSAVSAEAAAEHTRAQPSLELAGLYCHLGPQVTSMGHYEAAARHLVAFMAKLGGLPELHLGGGPAVPCQPGQAGTWTSPSSRGGSAAWSGGHAPHTASPCRAWPSSRIARSSARPG